MVLSKRPAAIIHCRASRCPLSETPSTVSLKPSQTQRADLEMIEHIAGDQRMRFTEASTFTCSRCRGVETSNLLAISDSDCSKRFCNGCYGLLVSQQQAADEIYRESVLQAKRV